MKLRNKKTGEIKELGCIHLIEKNLKTLNAYKRLTQLNEEWEDYKPAEPLIKDPKIQEFLKLLDELKCSTKQLEERLKNLNEAIEELCGEEK